MRVMLMIKGDPQPGAAPSEELLGAMGSYNDELKEAGVLIDLAGLLPSAMGRRVRLAGGNRRGRDRDPSGVRAGGVRRIHLAVVSASEADPGSGGDEDRVILPKSPQGAAATGSVRDLTIGL